jgi:hypothetical protein
MMHPQIPQETQRWVLKWNNMRRKSWGTLPNSQHFGGRRACWSSKMGLWWIRKREFKMISTCITKKIGRLVQVEWKWCDEFSKDNLKHKLYMARNLWVEASFSFSVIYFVPFHGDYIQMSLFLRTPKWESQNWDSCCSKTLNVHIFLKSIMFWECEDNVLWHLKIFFQRGITHFNWTSFDLCSQGIYGRESNSQFDSHPFFWS